jgi:hypothetical protein
MVTWLFLSHIAGEQIGKLGQVAMADTALEVVWGSTGEL